MSKTFNKLILALTVVMLIGCRQLALPQTLNYFGFSLVDCGWDDPGDDANKTNYIDEVANFTNIAQMCVFSSDDAIGNRIDKFNQAGVKAILHIEPILFERRREISPSGVKRAILRANAQAEWLKFVNINKNVLNTNFLAALYIADEPVWNGISKEDFTLALQIVKKSLPNIPTMAVEAYAVVENDKIMIPQELDWIGFDRYDTIDPQHDAVYLADLNKVSKARTRTDQKIVIVSSSQWLPYYQTDAGLSSSAMGEVINSYYTLAASHPDVIALVVYPWPGGLDDPKQLGARNLPANVQQTLQSVGAAITGK